MSLIDDMSKGLAPHTHTLTGTIDEHGRAIQEGIKELRNRISDLGRPDTGDTLKYLNFRKKTAEAIFFEGPTVGEIWTIQTMVSNGAVAKTPPFVIRTNTGRLIFAVKVEEMANLVTSGNIVLAAGEELILEPSAEGAYDFTISYLLRKFRRPPADGGHGESGEMYTEHNPHESDRDFPPTYGPTDVADPE